MSTYFFADTGQITRLRGKHSVCLTRYTATGAIFSMKIDLYEAGLVFCLTGRVDAQDKQLSVALLPRTKIMPRYIAVV